MPPGLALYEDVFANGATLALPAAARMIFLVHGSATIEGRTLRGGEAWWGESAATITAGGEGASSWRYELAPPPAPAAPGVSVREKLSAILDTLPAGDFFCAAIASPFRPAVAPIGTPIKGRASAA
jgi:hypothetical protein